MLLAAMAWLAACTLPALEPAGADARVAASIRAHYEQVLPDLPEGKQRHYAQRLYRITGDARYLPFNRAHGQRLVRQIGAEAQALHLPGHAARRASQLLADHPMQTDRQRVRKQMLAGWGQMIYASQLAFELFQAQSYGLLNERDIPGHGAVLQYLASVDFRSFVLDREVMSIYAAQVANLVYFLHGLEVTDLRHEAMAAFRQQYPPGRDAALSQAEYRNKIYGMTHFVIAASDYYQKPVSAQEFAWVLDEFAASVNQILARGKEDIFTEVGISFLLAGQPEHAVVRRMRDAIVRAYDPVARMIGSEQGDFHLAGGEHRNVLAIMLLLWPEQLHPGPLL